MVELTKNCRKCGKIFHKSSFESVKCWNERHKFCSRTCFCLAMKENPEWFGSSKTRYAPGHGFDETTLDKMSKSHLGQRPVNYGILSKTRKRSMISSRVQRKKIFEELGCECSRCGKEQPVIHHKKDFFESRNDSIENLEILCRACHMSEHRGRGDL